MSARLTRLIAEAMFENVAMRELLKMVTAPDHRVLVRWMQTKAMPQRRALEVARMGASVLRCQPRSARNTELRTPIVALAQRHCRFSVGYIYLELYQRGECVNYD